MFQYATTFAASKMHNCDILMPDIECELYDTFPHLSCKKKPPEEIISSAKFVFRPNERMDFVYDQNILSCRADCVLDGYYQSELYFSKFRNEVLEEFRFSELVKNESIDLLQVIHGGSSPLCAVHFRRGDYVGLGDVHTNLDHEYYSTCFSYMKEQVPGIKFVAFSDDREWCRENLPKDIVVPASVSAQHDLCAMSLCDYHIIANSSFSWWGSWLSNSKMTIAPKQWFGPAGPKAWETIYCKGWGIA